MYVTSPGSVFHIEHHDAGMALHASWSRWHGIRRWSISFPDNAPSRIPLPTAFSDGAYSKRTVRVEYQGKPPAIGNQNDHLKTLGSDMHQLHKLLVAPVVLFELNDQPLIC